MHCRSFVKASTMIFLTSCMRRSTKIYLTVSHYNKSYIVVNLYFCIEKINSVHDVLYTSLRFLLESVLCNMKYNLYKRVTD